MRDLTPIATGRNQSLFAEDIRARHDAISQSLTGRRVLIVGGAGSIGSATLRVLLGYAPAKVDVIDHDENALAELVRDLRAGGFVAESTDLVLMPIDYGAPVARQFLRRSGPYEVVLHFAAMKHVRSEKDPASILHMLDTNVLKQQRLLEWLAIENIPERYFAVSTDKAANPVNFMGASKRLMEQLIFTDSLSPIRAAVRTAARFANVAFSAGSLLESFTRRLSRRQPIAVPRDTRRYFVSLEESAHICLLAATAVPSRHIAIPRLREERDMRELIPIAASFLKSNGYEPVEYHDEHSARAAVEADAARGRWPLLPTQRDTEGEKGYEEFVAAGESAVGIGLESLQAVPQSGADASTLSNTLETLRAWVIDGAAAPTREEIERALRRVIPEFQPVPGGRRLDDRM